MNFFNKKNLPLTLILATLYCGLTITFSAIAFGVAQFRISECLTILPIFVPEAVFGLPIGCLFANAYGVLTDKVEGSMPIDILLGSLAGLLGTYLTYLIGKKVKSKILRYALAPFPTFFFKTLVVSSEITYFYGDTFISNLFHIGFAEFVVCYVLGIPLMFFLYKNDIYKKIFN